MRRLGVAGALFILALAPLVVLAILALLGARARADVGVVTTGSGEHMALGAAWVAAWLATVVVTPIAAVASVCAVAARFVLELAQRSRR